MNIVVAADGPLEATNKSGYQSGRVCRFLVESISVRPAVAGGPREWVVKLNLLPVPREGRTSVDCFWYCDECGAKLVTGGLCPGQAEMFPGRIPFLRNNACQCCGNVASLMKYPVPPDITKARVLAASEFYGPWNREQEHEKAT